MFVTRRSAHNPILAPDKNKYFESFAVFNMSVVRKNNKKKGEMFGFYRAISGVDPVTVPSQMSIIGLAQSKDGIHFKGRRQFIEPQYEWDRYGCEDPRVTYFEGKYYIFYTAISKYPADPESIKVAVAVSKDLKKIDERHLVTTFNAKAMALFPERINGKITLIFSKNTDKPPAELKIVQVDKIEELWSPDFWSNWEINDNKNNGAYTLDPKRNVSDHIEVGAVPIKTKYGWLLVYSHIQNYFESGDHLPKIFGIEALLLDLKNPNQIIGKTRGPIIVPEEQIELNGYIKDVVFPSGAILNKDDLTIYYGAADTTVCSATVSLLDLVSSMRKETGDEYFFKRHNRNPIISPIKEHEWEAQCTFNPGALDIKGNVHILYRAFSSDNTSSIGYAKSKNGFDITERLPYPIYSAREDFEMKKIPNGYSGCEDPRLTKIGNNIYMCYVAYDGVGAPRVAVTSIALKDFLAQNWNWSKPFLISPEGFDDKDTCIFPTRFKEGYFIMHRVNNTICGAYLDTLDTNHEVVKKCIHILSPRENTWDSAKVGIASPPIKTKYGWLLLYHGVSKSHSTYRVGAVLLSLKDPAIVLARSTDPIFEPMESYEHEGLVHNVVFPCGIIERKGVLYIYYGGGDKVVGVATMKKDIILKALLRGRK